MKLDESRARYFNLYDLAPVGYVTLNEKGLIELSNFTFATQLGVTRADLVQRPLSRFMSQADADSFYLLRKKLLATGNPQSSELELVKPKGDKLWMQLEATVAEEDGARMSRIALTDITARRKIQADNELLERKIREMQKLESLGVLAGGVAHDFNNLLTVILGSSTLAERELTSESPVRVHLQSISEASHRAADLCKQMLDYSGRGRFVLERLDCSQLVEATAQLLKISISKKVEMRFNLQPGLPLIQGDATQLRQVIMNLVINASESIVSSGGVISLTTGRSNLEQPLPSEFGLGSDLPAGEYIFFEVTDNGCGMTAETRAKVFDPFFTSKFSGRGLGLAAVLGIVRGHKGAVKVTSEVDRGSTFRILIPVARTPSVAPQPKPTDRTRALGTVHATATKYWQGSGTVLVVDDEESIRLVTGQVLQLSGFDPVLAVDGQDALEIFRADPDRFTLVLLDLTMPRMGGEETFAEMKKLRPEVKVVLMSGYDQKNAMVRFPRSGPVRFLPKPFTVDSLCAVLAEVLGGSERAVE